MSTGLCIGVLMNWDGCTGATRVLRYPALSYGPS